MRNLRCVRFLIFIIYSRIVLPLAVQNTRGGEAMAYFIVLIAFLLILFVAAAAVGTLTVMLVHIAIDREVPRFLKGRRGLRDIVKNDEFVDSLCASAKQLEDACPERVEICGHGGTRLVGHIFPAEKPERIIIAVHGWRSSWCDDFGIAADFFKRTNSTVLFVEQRAQRGSEGEFMSFGVLERYDVVEWVRFASHNLNSNLPIYLCGVSMGATTVLLSSELGLPENIRGIIADCGFTSVMDIWESVVHKMHLPFLLMKRFAGKIFEHRVGVSPICCSTLSAMQSCKIPILFIHGEEDGFVPVEMTYKNYNACRAKKFLLTVKSANHGMSYYVNRAAYEGAIVNFFKETSLTQNG